MLSLPSFEFDDKILMQGAEISRKLDQLRQEKFPPDAKKTLRRFPMAEVAHYLGVSPNNLKRLHLEGKGPIPLITIGGRRFYTAEQMIELRHFSTKIVDPTRRNTYPSEKPMKSCRSLLS